MDILGLDKDFAPVDYLRYLNLQWKRRYYEPGQFSAQILADDFDPSVRYLYAPERPEMGIAEKVQLTHEVKGDFLQISGTFMESVLNRCYAYPHITGEFSLYALGRNFIEDRSTQDAPVRPDWWYRLEEFGITVDAATPRNITVNVDWQDEPLGECAYSTLKTLEMSQRIAYNPDTGKLTWLPWQGLDRTQDQAVNAWALFSDDSRYVTRFSYTADESGYRNHAVVFYGRDSIGDPYRHDVYGDNWVEEGRRCILMNVDDTLDATGRTKKAKEELLKYPIVHEADIDVIQDGLLYLVDYDLGDKCDVVCHALGKSFSARITGVDEVWKGGQHTVGLTLGESSRTAYQRVARFARSDTRARSLPVVTISEE